MNIIHQSFTVSTGRRNEMIDITGKVTSVVEESGIADGDVIVYCPHTTAAITINENADPSVVHDILLTLEELLPKNRSGDRHYEGNSDSHCKSSILGCSEQILVRNKSLELGTWQAIYFCEFDGPRNRKLYIKIMQ